MPWIQRPIHYAAAGEGAEQIGGDYYNTDTGQTSWTRPADFDPYAEAHALGLQVDTSTANPSYWKNGVRGIYAGGEWLPMDQALAAARVGGGGFVAGEGGGDIANKWELAMQSQGRNPSADDFFTKALGIGIPLAGAAITAGGLGAFGNIGASSAATSAVGPYGGFDASAISGADFAAMPEFGGQPGLMQFADASSMDVPILDANQFPDSGMPWPDNVVQGDSGLQQLAAPGSSPMDWYDGDFYPNTTNGLPDPSTKKGVWDSVLETMKPKNLSDWLKLGSVGIGGLGLVGGMITGANAKKTAAANADRNRQSQMARQQVIDNPGTGSYGFSNASPLTRNYIAPGDTRKYGQAPSPLMGRLFYDNVNPQRQARGGPVRTRYARGGMSSGLSMMAPQAQGHIDGSSPGQADDVSAQLSPGEYVMDADVVAAIGDGNTDAGAQRLDHFREAIRRHKRSAPASKIPPKTKPLHRYLGGR